MEDSSSSLLQRHYHFCVTLLTLSITTVLLDQDFNLALTVLKNMMMMQFSFLVIVL